MILRTVEQIKKSIPVSKSMTYDKVEPFIKDAEKIIIDSISQDMYDALDTYIDSLANENPETNAEYDKLIELLRNSISFLSYHFGFDILNAVFSDQGFHRIESENGGTKALFQRQEENLKRTFKIQGYNKLDLALEYMESNKDEFAEWVASDAYTLFKKYIINTAKEFSTIYPINNSRVVFMKLIPFQVLVEDFDIIPLIGAEYYDSLKTQILSGTISNADIKFLNYLRKAVAFCTIARGGFSLITELNEFGIYQVQFEAVEANLKSESPAPKDIAFQILDAAKANAQAYLKTCESFLKKNITDYPLYANSSAYDDEGSSFEINGTDKVVVI